jgi:predicted  nucleic acid-binding Zn-ribbon protein
MNSDEILILLCGIGLGIILGWFFFRLIHGKKGIDNNELIARYVSKDAYEQLLRTYESLKEQNQFKEQEIRELNGEQATLKSERQFLEKQLTTQKVELTELEKRFQSQFEKFRKCRGFI